jgi:hypothetical protein
MQQPESTEINGTIYLTPFKRQVWIAMMAVIFLLAFFLSVCFFVAYYYTKAEKRHYRPWESSFSVFACFCMQGSNRKLKYSCFLACIHAFIYVESFMNICIFVNVTADTPTMWLYVSCPGALKGRFWAPRIFSLVARTLSLLYKIFLNASNYLSFWQKFCKH